VRRIHPESGDQFEKDPLSTRTWLFPAGLAACGVALFVGIADSKPAETQTVEGGRTVQVETVRPKAKGVIIEYCPAGDNLIDHRVGYVGASCLELYVSQEVTRTGLGSDIKLGAQYLSRHSFVGDVQTKLNTL
jgi:hypothetical protein